MEYAKRIYIRIQEQDFHMPIYYSLMFGHTDGIMIISVIVPMLTNYLVMPLIYLTAASFFPESEGVNVNANLRIL